MTSTTSSVTYRPSPTSPDERPLPRKGSASVPETSDTRTRAPSFGERRPWDPSAEPRTPTPPRARDLPRSCPTSEDRPITASGYYAFEATDRNLPARKPTATSHASSPSGLSAAASPTRPSMTTRMAATRCFCAKLAALSPDVLRVALSFSSPHAVAGTEVSTKAVLGSPSVDNSAGFGSEDEYSDDFDEEDGDAVGATRSAASSATAEYGAASQARDEQDADLLVDVLRSFLVAPEGIPEESEADFVHTTASFDATHQSGFVATAGAASLAPASVPSTMAGSASGTAGVGASKSAIRAATAEIACPKPLGRDKVPPTPALGGLCVLHVMWCAGGCVRVCARACVCSAPC